MITKLSRASRISLDFIAVDIENAPDGTLLAIHTYDGTNHFVHYDWYSWLRFTGKNAKDFKAYRMIYAYNGGGWDWLSFLEWAIQSGENPSFSTIQNGTRLIAVILKIGETTVRLCDAMLYFGQPPPPLDDVARKFIGRGKADNSKVVPKEITDPGFRIMWLWENKRELFFEYLRIDTEILYETMVAFCNLVFARIACIPKLGMTLPSTSLKCFQTEFLSHEVSIPENEDVKLALRLAYRGGRVECFKPDYYERINVYDFNSLYPSVMATTPVPTSGNALWTDSMDLDSCGCFHIRFDQRNRSLLPVLMLKGEGVYKGEGWFFTNEIRRLVRKARGKVDVINGFHFQSEDILFRNFVDRLYKLRMSDKVPDGKGEMKDGPLGSVCKLLMNSLYGKFGQQPERTKTCILEAEEALRLIADGNEVESINDEIGLYRVTEEHSPMFEHVGIAGTITSEARARLWEAFDKGGVVYCDTDSIHTTETLKYDNDKLGSLKHEFSGEGVYCGKKLYALRNKEKTKVRAKGVRVGGKMGFSLGFEDLRSLLRGHTIATSFVSSPTVTNVLSGGRSCTFDEKVNRTCRRNRRIRKTANGPDQ